MARKNAPGIIRWILILNLLIMLFPPIHLWFADGSMPLALTYFFGSGIILVISMVALKIADGSAAEE